MTQVQRKRLIEQLHWLQVVEQKDLDNAEIRMHMKKVHGFLTNIHGRFFKVAIIHLLRLTRQNVPLYTILILYNLYRVTLQTSIKKFHLYHFISFSVSKFFLQPHLPASFAYATP